MRSSILFTIPTVIGLATAKSYNKSFTITDADNFCMLIPPANPTEAIAILEADASPACKGNVTNVKADPFASDFITSANYLQTDDYVQVTGCINPLVYNIDPNDEGGQFDMKSTPGSICSGYGAFLELIEPADGRYCIRCCVSTNHGRGSFCNIGKSEYGCLENISDGTYALANGTTCPTYRQDTTTQSTTTTKTPPQVGSILTRSMKMDSEDIKIHHNK